MAVHAQAACSHQRSENRRCRSGQGAGGPGSGPGGGMRTGDRSSQQTSRVFDEKRRGGKKEEGREGGRAAEKDRHTGVDVAGQAAKLSAIKLTIGNQRE